jgi:hypothetical protein
MTHSTFGVIGTELESRAHKHKAAEGYDWKISFDKKL